jgi:hypothetical protein
MVAHNHRQVQIFRLARPRRPDGLTRTLTEPADQPALEFRRAAPRRQTPDGRQYVQAAGVQVLGSLNAVSNGRLAEIRWESRSTPR